MILIRLIRLFDDMLYICIFSNKLDLNQAIRVSHSIDHGIVQDPGVNCNGSCTLPRFFVTPLATVTVLLTYLAHS